jgi:hypothetical protein
VKECKMSERTPKPWPIEWYICTDDDGKELWRAAKSIGPLYPDHDHWARSHLGVDKEDAYVAAAAPDMLDELKQILEWAIHEKAPLREQEIASIRSVIDKAEGRDE